MLFAGVLMLGVFTPIAATAAPGQLLVRDKTVVEDAGTVSVRIVLAKRVNHRVWVSYRTKSGTAVAGSDFTAVSGKLKFPRGAKVRHVTVPLLNDTAVEGNERFRVRIFDPVRASIRDRVGRVTILDDDVTPPYVPPTMSVKDASAQEGAALTFEVSLSKAAEGDVTFSYATADGTAKAPGDYTAVSGGKGTIPKGATSTEVSVQTTEDSTPESTESMSLTLSAPTGATIDDGEAKGTITDDDEKVSLSVADTSVLEGKKAEFTVTLSKVSGLEVRVEWETGDGTAVAPDDYKKSDGVVTIKPGDKTGTFLVETVDDSKDEVDETFKVTLSAPHNATISDGTAVATIRDNDGPVLSIADAQATEGTALIFNVSLSKVSVQEVKVDWATAFDTATAADLTAAKGTLTIPANTLTGKIEVPTLQDTVKDVGEKFFVNLSNPVNASVGDSQGVGLIVDDD